MLGPVAPPAAKARAAELTQLCQLITRHVATGETGKTVVEFLFQQYGLGQTHVSLDDILNACNCWEDAKGNPKDDARSELRHLRHKIPRLFEKHPEGIKQRLKAWIDDRKGNYALHVGENDSAKSPQSDLTAELVKDFWRPYLARDKPVRICYPEPVFYRDERNTYVRNAEDDFSYLQNTGRLERNFYFVSSGLVRAILTLVEFFQSNGVHCSFTSVRVGAAPEEFDDEHVIIVGTPTSNEVVAIWEEGRPLHTAKKAVMWNYDMSYSYIFAQGAERRKEYLDDENERLEGTKWALLTRFEHRGGRFVTILSAKHGRTVQELTKFLTRDKELVVLRNLTRRLKSKNTFPDHFQALFQIEMTKKDGGRANATKPEMVISLDRIAKRKATHSGR